MRIRLHVKTPPGHARSVEKQLRLFLLGKLKKPADTYMAPKGESFYWEIDCDAKTYFRIQRNARLFQMLAQGTLDEIDKKTWVKKMAGITGTTITGARGLLKETSVEILKQASAEEIVQANTTFWERIKKTFHKEKI